MDILETRIQQTDSELDGNIELCYAGTIDVGDLFAGNIDVDDICAGNIDVDDVLDQVISIPVSPQQSLRLNMSKSCSAPLIARISIFHCKGL